MKKITLTILKDLNSASELGCAKEQCLKESSIKFLGLDLREGRHSVFKKSDYETAVICRGSTRLK